MHRWYDVRMNQMCGYGIRLKRVGERLTRGVDPMFRVLFDVVVQHLSSLSVYRPISMKQLELRSATRSAYKEMLMPSLASLCMFVATPLCHDHQCLSSRLRQTGDRHSSPRFLQGFFRVRASSTEEGIWASSSQSSGFDVFKPSTRLPFLTHRSTSLRKT